jgi:very-short-patch-repair endonuclease
VLRDPERETKQRARALRASMTDAEIILWSRLRRLALGGHRFRRQHPIGPYIADFACALSKLVVEIDGATHGSDIEIAHDRRRDAYLRSRGWRVLRFSNEDVYRRLDDVLDGICRFAPPPAVSRRPPP